MTWEDQIFVANVVVIDPMWETVALSVISQLVGAIAKLSAIAKICKYKGLHEGHHFISMAMEVHGTPKRDMDRFINECVRIFHDRWSKGHLSLSFRIQFFRQCDNIVVQRALASIIKRKIMLIGDACFRPPITIRSHDLHVDNVRSPWAR